MFIVEVLYNDTWHPVKIRPTKQYEHIGFCCAVFDAYSKAVKFMNAHIKHIARSGVVGTFRIKQVQVME